MRAATIAVVVLLGACQPEGPPKVTGAGAALDRETEAPAGADDQRLSGFVLDDPIEPLEEEEQAVDVAAVPTDLDSNPTGLRGLTSPLLQAALGPPSFRRRDRDAEVWQYYADGCVLDLFLYPEASHHRVAHYVLRSRAPGEAAPANCLPAIVAKARRGGG